WSIPEYDHKTTMGRSIRVIYFIFLLCLYKGYSQQLTNYLHDLFYADSFFYADIPDNSIQSSYRFSNYYSSDSPEQRLNLEFNGPAFQSNYTRHNLSFNFDYFRPDFTMRYENKSNTYSIVRHFDDDFYRLNARFSIFSRTDLIANYNKINQESYGIGLRQDFDDYAIGIHLNHSKRFFDLRANGESLTNRLIIPLGYSELSAELETDDFEISYENRAFDQTITHGSRIYSNNGREFRIGLKLDDYGIKTSFLNRDLGLSGRQNNDQFLKLGKIRTLQFDFSKGFAFRNWCFRFYYQYLENKLIGNSSFIDAWPFNVFDFLSSDRLRINRFFTKIQTIGFSSERHFHIKRLEIQGEFNYEHYIFSGSSDYSRRYYVIFPIITDYHYLSENFTVDPDASVNLQVQISYPINRFRLSLVASQFVPLDYSKINRRSSGSSKDTISQSGGFKSVLSISYRFR
ncbi:MAG: hypothetical protein KDD94_13700, partial [Calditrichaeota bacterium]|nr:hypothetical protein [Calditrichota bacterium]